MKIGPHVVLPLLILAAAIGGAYAMVKFRRQVAVQPPEVVSPLVRSTVAHKRDLRIDIDSQGEVVPTTAIDLISEVTGKVTWVADTLVAGGFFADKEPLVRIDRRDHEVAVEAARASVAQAEVGLSREQAESEVARREWANMGGGKGSPLTLREPQVREAEARLASAKAALAKAMLDLERTTVCAPFAGRVERKQVDLGMFVSRGAPLARLYATDAIEVRVPVHDSELQFLDLPMTGADSSLERPATLVALFAGQRHEWPARIVRTEGTLDSKTRQLHVVVRVDDPYYRHQRRQPGDQRPPLALGLFVQATLQGRLFRAIITIPRDALRPDNEVLVIDKQSRLRRRKVQVLRAGMQDVFLSGGIEDGETICISPMTTAVEGMEVRRADATGAVETGNGENGTKR